MSTTLTSQVSLAQCYQSCRSLLGGQTSFVASDHSRRTWKPLEILWFTFEENAFFFFFM